MENKKTPKEILRKNYRAFIKKFTDRQYTAKRLLDKTGLTKTKNLIINSQGASGKAKRVFEEAYAKQVPTKLNMGKSCLRMSNVNYIPFELIGELVSKISVDQWIELYEHSGATSGNN